jgi:hypothetical protein
VGTGTVYTNGSTTTVPGEGTHVLRVQATDTAGNQSDVVAWTYSVDTMAPSLSANKASSAWVTASIGTVTLTVSDASPGSGLQLQKYRWNNSDVVNGTSFTSGVGIGIPADGDHVLYLLGKDIAGNTTLWQGQYRQDLQSPSVSGDKSQTAWRTTALGAVTLTASDATPGSGLKEARYYWGTAAQSAMVRTGTLYTSGATVSMPSEGERYLYLMGTDHAGRESAIWTGTYRVDTVTPVVSATKSSSSWYKTAIGSIVLSVSDATPGSGVATAKYRWNNPDVSGGTAFTHGATITVPSEGAHTLYIQAWDVAGNASTVWMGSYKQDTVLPTANATLAGANWNTQAIGAITLTASDTTPGSGFQTAKYRWNNADVGNGTVFSSGQTIVVPNEGANTLYIQAWDVAGNASALWQGAYNSDTVAPILSATKASETWQNTAIGTIVVSASDTAPGSGLATLRYRWDNADAVNGTVFVSGQGLSIPSEGAHTLYLYARDVAGNVSQWQGPYRQDTIRPEISANKNQFVWYRAPIGPITVSVTDVVPGSGIAWALTKYRWNNADVRNGTALTAGQTLTLPAEGANTLYLETFDNALNVSQTWTGIYNQDTQSPTAYATPTLEAWTSANPTIVLHYADAGNSGWQYRQFRWNGGTWQTYTGQTVSVPAEGENTLELAAGDVAGNTVTWSGVYRVDWNAPVVENFQSSVGASYHPVKDGPMRMSFIAADTTPGVLDYAVRVMRGTELIRELAAGSVSANGVISVVWDGRNVTGDYVLDTKDSSVAYEVFVTMSDRLRTVSSVLQPITVTYTETNITYEYRDGQGFFDATRTPPLFSKLGTTIWGVIPGKVSVEIRRSENGLDWSAPYRSLQTGGATLGGTLPPVFNVLQSATEAVITVQYTLANGEQMRVQLPKAYEGFSAGYGHSLLPGFRRDSYPYHTDKNTASYVKPHSDAEGDIVLGELYLDFWDGSDYFSQTYQGFLRLPDSEPEGTYELVLQVDDGYVMSLNGSRSLVVELKRGLPLPFQILFHEEDGKAYFRAFIRNQATGIQKRISGEWLFQDWVHESSMLKRLDQAYTLGAWHLYYDNQVAKQFDGSWGPFGNERGKLLGCGIANGLDFDWGGGKPAMSEGDNDHFSTYWSAYVYIDESRIYQVRIESDDGVVLVVDGIRRASQWNNHVMKHNFNLTLDKGFHLFEHFYREGQGGANTSMKLYKEADNPATNYPLSRYSYTRYLNHELFPLTGGISTLQSLATVSGAFQGGIHLLSPTQNPTLRTSTPVLTWQTPSMNAAHSITLTHESGLGLSGISATRGDSFTWRLLPGEIQWRWDPKGDSPLKNNSASPEGEVGYPIAAYTPSWKDSLAPGTWTWQVQLGNNGTGPVSDIGTFTLDPPLEIHGVLNFPNPFKSDTRIRYKLSKSVNRVRVVIYTIGGAFVRELAGDTAATSLMQEYHDVFWDGRNAAGEQVVNGVYLYKVIAEGHGETKEASNRMFRLR